MTITDNNHRPLRSNGETRVFPIVGDPIAQVRSPAFLSDILAARGENALVVPALVAPADLDAFIAGHKGVGNSGGLVITVPHKAAALAHCDAPSERAAFAGSVNVIARMADGRWRGDNTDGLGCLNGVAAEGFDIAGKRALLVGVGGAGAAIAYEILARGAAHLAIHEIDTAKRDAMIARLDGLFPGRVSAGSADPTNHDFIMNATPVGMRPGDPLPVDAARLVPGQFVADAITKPAETPLIAAARALGCATMPGAGMFNAQAEILVDTLLSGATRD